MAKRPRPLTLTMHITGVRETLKALRDLPKDADRELRDAAGEIARDSVGWIKSAAAADSRQSAAVARTTRAVRDRLPVVQVGGNRKVGRRRTPAFKILFGANFGSHKLRQFRRWAGKGKDYVIFKTFDDRQGEIQRRWLAAADRVIDKFRDAEG